MRCTLCKEEIEGYREEFNRLAISERCHAYICQSCIDKFLLWQGDVIARLFPTKALKRRQKQRI